MPWGKYTEKIGYGRHSTVYLAGEAVPGRREPKHFAAVKTVSLEESASVKKELGFLEKFRNDPFIVQCFGVDQSLEGEKWCINLLLEYAQYGTLLNLISDYSGIMPESLIAYYTYMIMKGLESLHSKNIVHCDVKPCNILAFRSEKGFTQLKLSDFGESRYLDEKETRRYRGTVFYMSPEGAKLGTYDKASDVWALGCTVLMMMTGGKSLWSGDNISDKEVLQRLEKRMSPEIPDSVSEIGRDFLKRCFFPDHRRRLSVDRLLHHPFIVGNVKGKLPVTGFEGKVVNPFGYYRSCKGLFSTNPRVVKKEEDEKSDDVWGKFETSVRKPKSDVYKKTSL